MSHGSETSHCSRALAAAEGMQSRFGAFALPPVWRVSYYRLAMKLVIQRVNSASVAVEGQTVAEIGRGLLLFVGFGKDDTAEKLSPCAAKIANMRIFPHTETGRFDRSLIDIEGDILLVSQFTLFADTSKGRRPEFFGALEPEAASKLFSELAEAFSSLSIRRVGKGIFGAMMQVSLENDGPVTIVLDY